MNQLAMFLKKKIDQSYGLEEEFSTYSLMMSHAYVPQRHYDDM